MTVAIVALTGICAIVLRVALIWRHRLSGCDAYYFLLSSEVYKKERKLPIVLPPVYVLERTEQWYPPGFSIFLSYSPRKWLDKYYWVINPALDSLLAMITAWIAYAATGNEIITAVAGLCYILNAASMVDTTSLNSRILGTLLFTVAIASAVAFAASSNEWYAIPAILSSALMLLTHKSSSQLFYVLCLVLALAWWDWRWRFVLVLVASVVVALTMSRGFMVNIWRGQYDILSFWNSNWKKLGAHPIYESPAYRNREWRSTAIHQSGWHGFRKSVSYLGLNAFILPVAWTMLHYGDLPPFDRLMLWWVGITYAVGAATQLVPFLRFAGEGYRYLHLAAVPVSYVAALPIQYQWRPQWLYYALLLVTFLIGLYLIARLYRHTSSSKTNSLTYLDTGLGDIISYLKESRDVTNVLCIPTSVGDAVGYYTRKPVLRGTHNVYFRDVAPFFPVFRVPLDYLVKKYNVSHLVVMTTCVDAKVLELESEPVVKSGEYELYNMNER